MTQATGEIRNNEECNKECADGSWTVRTRAVSYVGSACVIAGASDFDLDDLNLVRHQFPGQRVTLDSDVITVWLTPPQGG